jgi:small-conductance mechanosensitive channel
LTPLTEAGIIPEMRLLLRFLLVFTLILGAPTALAEDAPAASASTPAPPTADQLNDQLADIQQQLSAKERPDDATLIELRNKVQTIQKQSTDLIGTLTPQSNSLQAKLTVLGAPPAKGAPPEAPEIASQRKDLSTSKADLDGQIKQANTASLDSVQVLNQISALQRDAFEAQLSQRTASPLTGSFWSSLAHDLPSDMAELGQLGRDIGAAIRQAWQPPNRLPFVLCLLAAIALLVARRLIEKLFIRLGAKYLPQGHLRRSTLATIITLITLACVGFAAYLAYLSLNWNHLLSEDLQNLLHALVRLICFCAYVAGLGRALLSVKRPSWRMPQVSDDTAEHLRPFPWLLAAAVFVMGTVDQINKDIGAGLAAVVITNGTLSLIIASLIGAVLLRMGHARRVMLAAGDTPARRPLWVGLLVFAAFAGVLVCWLAVLGGYFALSWVVARQIVWTSVIVLSLYLFSHLLHDVFETLFSPTERTGQRMQEAFGLSAERLEQTATILSGICRALLLLLAISLVFSRYGAGPTELLGRVAQLFSGGTDLGTLKIVPGDIFKAIAVAILGMLVVRVIKQWLSDQLLPKTSLELGMQNSIVTLLGYVGGILVFLLALAVLQVNLQSIAWVASALSVGIGFGLQAIVQNFISGLILLAERPVKVGDWVSLGGGVEGDVRRINVRATEIQMSDRSTMIVPNSQFISQNVRNVTLGHAQGRVQLQLSLPLSTDASKARTLILEVFRHHPATLETPSPSVTLDNLDGGTMTFVCTGYVKSPRDAGGVKSDILFELLNKLREAAIPLSSPQDMVIHTVRQAVAKSEASTVVGTDDAPGDINKTS